MFLPRRKNISDILENSKKNPLKKTLSATDLILIGIGCTIGTGIFVITGIAAAKYAGPAISISYLIAAIVCIFAGLAYAELASMVPVSGSAYTYSYMFLGEFVAWAVGWGLILEYLVGASTVASGWSGYMVGIFKSAGVIIPESLTKSYFEGGTINLPAIFVTLFIGFLLYRGTKESITLNRILVAVKLIVIFIFIARAAPMINFENYNVFAPFGLNGILFGAAVVFYAYIGFDAVATTAEECKNPEKDLPVGIIVSAIICAILYIAVSLSLTGITHYTNLNNAEPLAKALRDNGSNIGSTLVAVGAVAGITSVLLVLMYSQSRIFFVMSRDKMLPKFFSKIHPKNNTPSNSALIVTLFVALISSCFPLEFLSHMVSLGTLFAFIIVSIGVILLRIYEPTIKRSFKCPAVFITAPIAILSCSYLVFELLKKNLLYFGIWSGIGLLVYLAYGFKKSPFAR